jgi:hypothetical protein
MGDSNRVEKAAFSPEVGKPQLLAYTLTTSNNEQPTCGLITNGSSFRFFKLVKGEMPQYPLSKLLISSIQETNYIAF